MAKFFNGQPRKLEDNDKEFLLTKIKPLLKQNNISEAREVIVEAKLRI